MLSVPSASAHGSVNGDADALSDIVMDESRTTSRQASISRCWLFTMEGETDAALCTHLQPSVAPPAGPSKLNKSHTAADQADDEDMLDGGDSEEQSEDSDDDQIEDDDDEAQEGSTPGRRMTDRQKEKAAEKASKANNRSAKKVSCRSVQV